MFGSWLRTVIPLHNNYFNTYVAFKSVLTELHCIFCNKLMNSSSLNIYTFYFIIWVKHLCFSCLTLNGSKYQVWNIYSTQNCTVVTLIARTITSVFLLCVCGGGVDYFSNPHTLIKTEKTYQKWLVVLINNITCSHGEGCLCGIIMQLLLGMLRVFCFCFNFLKLNRWMCMHIILACIYLSIFSFFS